MSKNNNNYTEEEFEDFVHEVREDPNTMRGYGTAFLKAAKEWAEGRRRYRYILDALVIELLGRQLQAWGRSP